MRQNLSNLKQVENESMYSFLSRVINLYYRSRDQETPTMDQISTDKVSRTDIVHIFLEGLLNKDIKTNLRMRLSTIDFKDLSKVAREIEQALPPRSSINFADKISNVDLSEKIENLEKSMKNMVLHFNTRFSRSRTPNRQVRFNRSSSRNRHNYSGAGSSNKFKRDRSNSRGRNYQAKKSWRDLPKANFRCHNCGKYGHTKRWCRLPLKPATK